MKPLKEILKSSPDDFYVIYENRVGSTVHINVKTILPYELRDVLDLYTMYFEVDYKKYNLVPIELIMIGYLRKIAHLKYLYLSLPDFIIDLLNSDFMTNRFLAWKSSDGQMVPVNKMTDEHLLNCIALQRIRIASVKLQTGHTSLSILTLKYMEEEADDRGLNHATSPES